MYKFNNIDYLLNLPPRLRNGNFVPNCVFNPRTKSHKNTVKYVEYEEQQRFWPKK